jgi:hypothetical protein
VRREGVPTLPAWEPGRTRIPRMNGSDPFIRGIRVLNRDWYNIQSYV